MPGQLHLGIYDSPVVATRHTQRLLVHTWVASLLPCTILYVEGKNTLDCTCILQKKEEKKKSHTHMHTDTDTLIIDCAI